MEPSGAERSRTEPSAAERSRARRPLAGSESPEELDFNAFRFATFLYSAFYFVAPGGVRGGSEGRSFYIFLLFCFVLVFFCISIHREGGTGSVGLHVPVSQRRIMRPRLHAVRRESNASHGF